MRKFFALLIVLLFLIPSAALAAEPEEEIITHQVIVPSFDIWQHSNGVWQDTDGCGERDYYGWKGKTLPGTFTLPESVWKGKYKLTHAEIAYPFTQEQFNSSGRQEDWKIFKQDYLAKTPTNYSVAKAGENLDEGKVTAQWTFDLAPEWLDLKDPTVREQLGMDEKSFSNMAQGWRWYLPVLITWYGVPEKVLHPPDFSVTFDRHVIDNANPGDKVELIATYKLNESHDQPETAKLAALHAVGEGEYPLALEPVNPSDSLDVNGTIEFRPGETKQYSVKATVQGRNSKILAKIWPAGGEDANWSNNSDEAQIRLNQNLWVELNGDAERETREGNSVSLTAQIHNDSGSMIVTPVIWKMDGKIIKEISNFDIISQGSDSVTITPQAGSYTVTVEVNPGRNMPPDEMSWSDNKDSVTIDRLEDTSGGNSKLSFNPNPAKWWEMVTATLSPPKPTPPRGTITSWSISSAKLTYPKKHPDWTFGHPLDPVGTTTVNMSTGGHTSTVDFRQDWSNYGAEVYDVIDGRLIPGPTYYPISAEYKIDYTYKYKVRKCSGSGENRRCRTVTRTRSGSDSGTASAKILVDGTSRVPKAH